MKIITYKAEYSSPTGYPVESKVTVTARSINSGFAKALKLALRDLRDLSKGWELVSVTFWEVE